MDILRETELNIVDIVMFMEGKIAIVIDSAIASAEIYKDYNFVKIIPVYINIGEKSYKDGIDFTQASLIEEALNAKDWPKTSQPSPGDFDEIYRSFSSYKDIISIHVSQKLSGTLNSANSAKSQLEDDDNFKTNIHLFNSTNASIGAVPVISYIISEVENGISVDRILKGAEKVVSNMKWFAALQTLDFLVKGGRIKPLKGFLGKLLKKKPILKIEAGVLETLATVKGHEKAIIGARKEAFDGKTKEDTFNFIVGQVICRELANSLKKEIEAEFPKSKGEVREISSAISMHAGPGTIGFVVY